VLVGVGVCVCVCVDDGEELVEVGVNGGRPEGLSLLHALNPGLDPRSGKGLEGDLLGEVLPSTVQYLWKKAANAGRVLYPGQVRS
jgi:hypothetical protein